MEMGLHQSARLRHRGLLEVSCRLHEWIALACCISLLSRLLIVGRTLYDN